MSTTQTAEVISLKMIIFLKHNLKSKYVWSVLLVLLATVLILVQLSHHSQLPTNPRSLLGSCCPKKLQHISLTIKVLQCHQNKVYFIGK